jgi:beta-phosphoglucomutase
VVFDMDGVIVDSHPAHRSAWKAFLCTVGKEVSDRDLDFVMDGRKREDILLHFLGPLTDAQLLQYGKMKNDLFWQAAADVTPIPGAFEFIASLHDAGIAMAVATSASVGRTHSILNSTALRRYFGAVVTGDDVPKGKPDPGIYRLACQKLDCPPSAAVAIDDAVSGILAAKGAGLRCVGIIGQKCGDPMTAAGADCVLQDFVDLTVRKFSSLVAMQLRPSNLGDREAE